MSGPIERRREVTRDTTVTGRRQIESDDRVAGLGELHYAAASDEAERAGDEDVHARGTAEVS